MTKRQFHTTTTDDEGRKHHSFNFAQSQAVIGLILGVSAVLGLASGAVVATSKMVVAPMLTDLIEGHAGTEREWNDREHARIAAEVRRELVSAQALDRERWGDIVHRFDELTAKVDRLAERR